MHSQKKNENVEELENDLPFQLHYPWLPGIFT